MFSLHHCNFNFLHQSQSSYRRKQWHVLMTGSWTWQAFKNRSGIKYFSWGHRSPFPSLCFPRLRPLAVSLILLSFYYHDNSWVSKRVCFVCVSQSRLKVLFVHLCSHAKARVNECVARGWVLRQWERWGRQKSAKQEGLTVRLSNRQKNPQLGVWLWVPLHAQHRQIKRNLATTAIIFAMRVMQMTQ